MKQTKSIILVAALAIIIVLASCKQPSTNKETEYSFTSNDSTYVWSKLLDSASWKKSYNFQMFSIRDTLWVFHPDGNWFSANGKDWTKSALTNSIYNLAFLKYVHFNNAVYGLGHFEGNIEQFRFKPEIYRTTDLQHWDTISKNSNLPNRFFYHPFVFNNKIWIIGGEDKKHNMPISGIRQMALSGQSKKTTCLLVNAYTVRLSTSTERFIY
jgi:hypothetical protein